MLAAGTHNLSVLLASLLSASAAVLGWRLPSPPLGVASRGRTHRDPCARRRNLLERPCRRPALS